MAIWDEVTPKKVTKISSDSYKCPGCASNLLFDQETKKLKCTSCSSSYYPEFFEISDLLNRTIEREDNEADDSKNLKQEIICNNCGATVVTDKNTVSTFCAFCGSPALVTTRLSKSFKPDYIIPFKVTRSDAEEIFRKWASTKRYIPKDFISEGNIKKITGLYVPFWLIDADCNVDFIASGSREEDELITDYHVRREGTFKMRFVPFDGSKRISDSLMESIEPFDYTELTEFSSGYLPGYFAERYDLSSNDMANRISNRFRDYMKEEYPVFYSKDKYDHVIVTDDLSTSSNYDCYYALLPVWFMCYEYEGIYYRIAINGQTGEISGNAPVNNKEKKTKIAMHYIKGYSKLILLVGLVCMCLALIITSPFGAFMPFSYRLWFGFIFSVFFIIPLIFASITDEKENILSKFIEHFVTKIKEDSKQFEEKMYKAPPAGAYIYNRDKIIMKKEDKKIAVTPKALFYERTAYKRGL